MVYDIKITKGGELVVREWDSEMTDYVDETICKEEISFNIYSTVCLGVGVTLRDLFVLLAKDIAVFSVITSCPFLEELIMDAFSEPVINKDKEDIAILELSRFGTVIDGELHWNFDFHGRGEKEEYALEFSPPTTQNFYHGHYH